MSLPYPSMVFVPLDILTAEEMNQLVSNIESLSAGTGLADGAITSDKIDSAAYTTTRKRIGTWIDGKPLYRQILVNTTNPMTGEIIMGTISDADTVVKYAGFGYTTSSVRLDVPCINTSNLNLQIEVFIVSNTFYVKLGSSRTMKSIYTIVEFTSTND